ncbi:MAG: response regulator [bacterium]
MKIRILLADDHIVMRNGLCALLEKESDLEVVGQAGDGRETLRKAQECRPDVIVMDINMPDQSGIETARQIKAISPGVKILALSVFTQSLIVAQMIKAGASGYLPKSCSPQELCHAIRKVVQNHTYIDPAIQDAVVEYLQAESAPAAGAAAVLTPREREVLSLIAAGKTNKEMADALFVSEKTIESHRFQIMHKLGIHNLADLIKYAVREGFTSLETD